MRMLVGLLGWMARGVAVVVGPPCQAATSNLGHSTLKRDICCCACEKGAVGISRRLRDNTHVLGNAQGCFFDVMSPTSS